MSKYEPGQWKAAYASSSGGQYVILSDRKTILSITHGPDEYDIARLVAGLPALLEAEARIKAQRERYADAGPELLEACEVTLKNLPDGFANCNLSLKTMLKAAIARATGE